MEIVFWAVVAIIALVVGYVCASNVRPKTSRSACRIQSPLRTIRFPSQAEHFLTWG